MVLFNNKEGVVFTIVALVISSFILLLFFYIIELPLDHKVDVDRIKIVTANNFMFQAENIARAQAVVSSKEALSAMLEVMFVENSFVDDFDFEFVNCLEYGYFDLGGSNYCGDQANLKEKIEVDLYNFIRENTGLKVEFVVSDVFLNQSSPWLLDIHFLFNILMIEDDFSLNVSLNMSESFSIIGLKDPVHVVVDEVLVPLRVENFSDVIIISVDEKYNHISPDFNEKASTFNELVVNQRFFEYNKSPSFLDRLRGNFSPSDLGITSVVLPIYSDPSDYDTVIRSGSSSIDWHFWHNKLVPDSYGEYVFSSQIDVATVLAIDISQPYNLTNTLHKSIVPVSLAEQANASGSTYFNPI
ncbi:hypothetical protein KO361_02695 [Candidatus Woesearchaeota archaeon]|nr:hypothetical protein [Candidatus Woesearchaeota archaeon]